MRKEDELFTEPGAKRTPVDPADVESGDVMEMTLGDLRRMILEVMDDDVDGYDPNSAESLYGIYSDVYKEKHGIRPRWMRAEDHDAEGWQKELDLLYDEPSTYDDWQDMEPSPSDDFSMESEVTDEENVPDEFDSPSRIPMRGGTEVDALSSRGKNYHTWRAGQRASAKRSYNKRLRRS